VTDTDPAPRSYEEMPVAQLHAGAGDEIRHVWEEKTAPAEHIPQATLDAQAAFYEQVTMYVENGYDETEATIDFADSTYRDARLRHTGGTLHDVHRAGIKAVWDAAYEVGRVRGYASGLDDAEVR